MKRWFGRLIRLLLLLLVLGIIGIALFAAWQARYGLPDAFVELANRELAKEGFSMEAERARYLGKRGWVFDELRLYRTRGNHSPFFEGDLNLVFPIRAALDGQQLPDLLRVANGRLRFQQLDWEEQAMLHAPIVLESVNGTIGLTTNQVSFEALRAEMAGLQLRVEGRVPLGDSDRPRRSNDVDSISAIVDQIVKVAKEMDASIFSSPPELFVKLSPVDGTPVPDVGFELRADAPGRVSGCNFINGHVRGSYRDGSLNIDQLRIDDAAGNYLQFGGQLDPAADRFAGTLDLSYPMPVLRELLPKTLTTQLADAGLIVPGQISGKLDIGPAPLSQAARHWQGDVSIDRLRFRGTWFQNAAMHASLYGDALEVTNFTSVVGSRAGVGDTESEIRVNLADSSYYIRLATNADPRELIPLAPSLEQTFRALDFVDRPPDLEVEVSGTPGIPGSGRAQGTISGSNLIYNSTLIDYASMEVRYHNKITELRDIYVERPEGDLSGQVDIDNNRRRLKVDINSTLDIDALARLAGPVSERVIRPLDFRGDHLLTLKGAFDLTSNRNHQVVGTLYVENGGLSWLIFDDCRFRWELRNDHFTIADAQGNLFDGPFQGHAQVANLKKPGEQSLFVHMLLNRADMARLRLPNRDAEDIKLDGRLTARFELESQLGKSFGDALTMRGYVKLKDGRLFRVPLFGGLSRYLSKIIPGFGYSTQTEFYANFDVANRLTKFSEAELLGNVVSATGEGEWSFDNEINARVGVKLLRSDNLVADVLRLITSPVTFLMEFRLQGPLDDPEWKLVRIPKELQSLFK